MRQVEPERWEEFELRRHEPGVHTGRMGLMLVVVALGASLVIGCGGGGGKSSSGGLTKAELVKKGNAVCKRHNEKIAVAASKVLAGGRLPSPKQFGELAMGTIVPEYSAQLQELGRLKPPSEVADAYRGWLQQSRGTRARITKDPRVITNPTAFKSVNGKADKLGFAKECHVGPGL